MGTAMIDGSDSKCTQGSHSPPVGRKITDGKGVFEGEAQPREKSVHKLCGVSE